MNCMPSSTLNRHNYQFSVYINVSVFDHVKNVYKSGSGEQAYMNLCSTRTKPCTARSRCALGSTEAPS